MSVFCRISSALPLTADLEPAADFRPTLTPSGHFDESEVGSNPVHATALICASMGREFSQLAATIFLLTPYFRLDRIEYSQDALDHHT